MQEHWDVIIVGARCAGATLATLLARRGVSVLLLEAAERGTNMPMSTHFVQSPGMRVLDRLGLGTQLRALAPATTRFRYAFDSEVELIATTSAERAPHALRRSTLDPLLQDLAEQAGADLRCRHRVTDLIREGARVTGVVVRTPDHGEARLYADLVVGADGFRSTIAQLTAAPEYLTSEGTRSGYYAYFQAPKHWSAHWDSSFEHRGTDIRYVFRCDGDLLLLTYFGPQAEVLSWGSSHRERFAQKLSESESTRPFAEGKPVGPIVGAHQLHYYYRQAVGPGWALVGDAGHFKDVVTGQGMSDAFLDAERLAQAILDGRDAAYQHYWRERDVATLPLHFDANQQGEVGYNEPFIRFLLQRMAADLALCARVMRMLDRQLDPAELVPGKFMLRALGAALVRGRVDVLRGFVQTARRTVANARELTERKRLLAEASAELACALTVSRPSATSSVTLQSEVA